ncbi:MAG: SCP2 sterol-binding domain-containing protein [Candidatus Obscuribacterales bacterium]|jgi:putative sterol carrier protein
MDRLLEPVPQHWQAEHGVLSEEVSVLVTNPIEELEKRFNKQAAKNVTATYLFRITGNGGGAWLAQINNGDLTVVPVEEGKSPSPDCSISVSSEDLELIMSGKLSAMTAALSGMLAIDGELGLAMQLVPIFFEGQAPFV